MNRNRSKKSVTKQSSISSISSHVPLMTASRNDENHLLKQPLISKNATADVHNILQSFPMASSRESKLKRARTVCQPKGTISYTIADNDTLEKVALRFNSTPSELRQLNKLTTSTIFPGQVFFVPEERSPDDFNQPKSTPSPPAPLELSPSVLTKPKEGDAFILLTDRRSSNETSPRRQSQQDVGPMVWSMARQTNARPGHAHRLKSDSSIESEPLTEQDNNSKQAKKLQRSLSTDDNQQLDEECLQRFIKIHVRLMTEDHQSVAGTLLVTPNAVMFDPDVLDPLIKAHGIDKYGLIIRMDLLAGIALYEDLAMYEHEVTARDEEKRKMYHSISVKNLQHHSNNTPLNTDEKQIHDLMIFILDKIDKELNTTDTCVLFNASSALQRHLSADEDHRFLPIPQDDTYLDDSFQSFDDYKHSHGILIDDKTDKNDNFNQIPSEVSYVFDWTRFKRAVKVKRGCHLENCVPLDQYNKRFGEIDELLYKQQQNYFASPTIEIPYYLCIRTSVHTHDIPSLHAKQYKKSSENHTGNVYGEKPLEYEYWFAVPKEKIDHLYSFFLRWTPERELNPLIDDDDQTQPTTASQPITIDQSKTNDKSPNRGFVLLVTDDPELTSNHETTKTSKSEHYLKQQNSLLKEWEIISVDEIYRRINSIPVNTRYYDDGIPAPKFLHRSTLINEEQAKQILLELPVRLHGLNWCMIFSTETNGFSLNQLYRRSYEHDHDSPSLLIVKDVDQNVFGAFVPHQLTISEGVYGTGESFLFAFNPKFRVFNWSGGNEFFVKGDLNSLGFGIGEGTYGLWFDGDLYHGRTSSSKTFNSERLTTNEDFIIASIEVWTFTD